MSEHERLRRPNPARTKPIRDWSHLYSKSAPRPSEPGVEGKSEPTLSTLADSEEAINRGVEAGYRVIGEHIRRGQAAAEQFSPHKTNPVPPRDNSQIRQDDIQKLLERIFQSVSDLVPFWVELFNTLAASGLSRFSTAMQRSQAKSAAANGVADTAPPGQIPIEITSVQPARVTLDLYPGAAAGELASYELHATDPRKPPMTEIEFVAGDSEQAGFVKIRVPPDQPAGTYTGVIVDRNSGQPRGTLMVQISSD
jgi:hypothetical protein